MIDSDFLEPERLRAFVAVAESGNFTRAAERLHLTQPAASMQVRRLEESIGRSLFERNAQFVRLTDEGEALLGFARELLGVIGRARPAIRSATVGRISLVWDGKRFRHNAATFYPQPSPPGTSAL